MNIDIPTLLIDKKKVLQNIEAMKNKADQSGVIFRPHFKTHQSVVVGQWFKNLGIDKITVSSLTMAIKFAQKGWDDITIAFPVNIRELDEINSLASRINLNIIADNIESVKQCRRIINRPVGLFIEVDAGYHRSGIPSEDFHSIQEILNEIEDSSMVFKGFLSHFGNTYQAKSVNEVERIYQESLNDLLELKSFFIKYYPNMILSIGDTPSCSIKKSFEGIDEIRPGNFVYYDVMQYFIGSCSFDQMAVAIACPIVSKRPERNELVLYGGAVDLSKDTVIDQDGNQIFGLAVELTEDGWSEPIIGAYVRSLSQEHALLKVPSDIIHNFKVGDLIGILPIHSCLTVDLMKDKQIVI